MPGHVVRRHDLGGVLGDSVDDRVLDEGRVPVGHPQGVHGDNQIVGRDVLHRGRVGLRGHGARRPHRLEKPGDQEKAQ